MQRTQRNRLLDASNSGGADLKFRERVVPPCAAAPSRHQLSGLLGQTTIFLILPVFVLPNTNRQNTKGKHRRPNLWEQQFCLAQRTITALGQRMGSHVTLVSWMGVGNDVSLLYIFQHDCPLSLDSNSLTGKWNMARWKTALSIPTGGLPLPC